MKATTGSYEIRIDRAVLSSTHTFMRSEFNKKHSRNRYWSDCLDINSSLVHQLKYRKILALGECLRNFELMRLEDVGVLCEVSLRWADGLPFATNQKSDFDFKLYKKKRVFQTREGRSTYGPLLKQVVPNIVS